MPPCSTRSASPRSSKRSPTPAPTAGCSSSSSTTTRSASTCSASAGDTWSPAAATTWCRARASRASSSTGSSRRCSTTCPATQAYYLTWREHAQALATLVAGVQPAGGAVQPEEPAPERLAPRRRHRGAAARRAASSWSPRPSWCSASPPPGATSSSPATAAPAPHLHEIVREAFDRVVDTLRSRRRGSTSTRCSSSSLEQFERAGLWSESAPIVGVNAHSADPHYQPGAGQQLADPTRRLPAHRPVGEGEGGGQRLRRHHLVRRLRARRRPTGRRRCSAPWRGARDAALELVDVALPGDDGARLRGRRRGARR